MDILGFEALVKNLSTSPELHNKIYSSLTRIKSISRSAKSPKFKTVHDNLNVSVFSDCIAITCATSELANLIWTCGYLQADLFFQGVLLRGGICLGPVVHEDGMLYGEGLLLSYHLEQKSAVYPRIVVDPDLADTISLDWVNKFMRWDNDGLLSIEPFKFDAGCPYSPVLEEDGWCPRYIYLAEVAKELTKGHRIAKTVDQKSKWFWLSNRYNLAVEEYNRTNSSELSLITLKNG